MTLSDVIVIVHTEEVCRLVKQLFRDWRAPVPEGPVSPAYLFDVSDCHDHDLSSFQTVSVSMLLRYSHHQIFIFIGKCLDSL